MGGRGGSSGLKSGNIASKAKMPDLEGSEKQVKWAKDIREKILSQTDIIANQNIRESYFRLKGMHLATKPKQKHTKAEHKIITEVNEATRKSIVKEVSSHTKAKTFIDARNRIDLISAFEGAGKAYKAGRESLDKHIKESLNLS